MMAIGSVRVKCISEFVPRNHDLHKCPIWNKTEPFGELNCAWQFQRCNTVGSKFTTKLPFYQAPVPLMILNQNKYIASNVSYFDHKIP